MRDKNKNVPQTQSSQSTVQSQEKDADSSWQPETSSQEQQSSSDLTDGSQGMNLFYSIYNVDFPYSRIFFRRGHRRNKVT